MEERIRINELEPDSYKAMSGYEKYLNSTGMNKSLKEIIKIRASLINGCAFCLEMHTKDTLDNGVTPRLIFAISICWKLRLFDAKEKVVLQMTKVWNRIVVSTHMIFDGY